ncbi:hypothetical protein [Bacteroides thetaiotaomicron]|nr:hypothetical protein [Bacteroides thetaiotaomicron]
MERWLNYRKYTVDLHKMTVWFDEKHRIVCEKDADEVTKRCGWCH